MKKGSAHKSKAKAKKKSRRELFLNKHTDGLMREFLSHLTQASYQVAVNTGFRGSFINFLEELQEALQTVLSLDRSVKRRPKRFQTGVS